MRTASAPLKAILAAEVTRLTRLFEVTKTDGTILYFTDFDQDITFDGNVYRADIGFSSSAIVVAAGLGTQGVELEMFKSADGVSEEDVRNSLYDRAACVVYFIDRSKQDEVITAFGGTFGESKIKKQTISFQVNSLLNDNRDIATEVYSSTCRADLGDDRCTVDIEALKDTGTTSDESGSWNPNRSVLESTGLTAATDYFNFGVVRFTSGDNNGFAMEVKKYTKFSTYGKVWLTMNLPFQIQEGDTFEIWPGCDKALATCFSKFDNVVNFRGEPFLVPKETAPT